MTKAPVIAIDGTAGSGKGTVAALLSERLGFHLLESGRIYRAAGVLAMRGGDLPADNAKLQTAAETAARELMHAVQESGAGGLPQALGAMFANDDLDGEKAGKAASVLASVGGARAALMPLQRAARKAPGLVAEGRDMGTVVFPDALIKIYLDADLEVRAARRLQQLQNRGINAKINEVRAALASRDAKDKTRQHAPLREAESAIIMDSAQTPAENLAAQAAKLFYALTPPASGGE